MTMPNHHRFFRRDFIQTCVMEPPRWLPAPFYLAALPVPRQAHAVLPVSVGSKLAVWRKI
jgi:hypothetical protein